MHDKGMQPSPRSQQALLQGLAHLYNLVLYQYRTQHAGHGGVEVEGGKSPHVTGGSIYAFSLLEAFSERRQRSITQSGGKWHFLRLL